MEGLFKELEELSIKTPMSAHYFNFARSKGCWVFRFQHFLDEDRKTKSFEGKEPKEVLRNAINFLKNVSSEVEEYKVTIGEYEVVMKAGEDGFLEVMVLDELGEEIEGMIITNDNEETD